MFCLYPIIGFLLLNYGVIDDINNAGYYSGLFITIYSLAQIFSCGYLGKLSDNIGRKNVILFSSISSAILYIILGLSMNIYLTLFVRFMIGLFNANSNNVKSFISDLSTEETMGTNFGYVTFSWSIGIILGTIVGGNTYGLWFESRPILVLCCFASILYIISALVLCYCIPQDNENINVNIFDKLLSIKYSFPIFDVMQYRNNLKVISSITMYIFVNSMDISFSEIFPLWMILPTVNGGMQYDSKNVSYILSIGALGGIIAQPIYLFLEKRTKRIMMYRFSTILLVIFVIIIPYSNNANNSFLMLCIMNILRYIFGCWVWNIIYMIISSSAEEKDVGHVNGIAQSIGAVCDILFPQIADPTFSVIAQNNVDSFVNCRTAFGIIGLVNMIPFILSFYIDKTIINKKEQMIKEDMRYIDTNTDTPHVIK